ncbi:hypothetical protein [Marinomonas sp.]|uniref:hypothetical protein n=1 Tax=Marinomonas sp. TaxID=1904862 RepID=UPI003BA99A89
MSYSSVAKSPLFKGAELHDNEKSENVLLKEITASHHLIRNNPLLRVGVSLSCKLYWWRRKACFRS